MTDPHTADAPTPTGRKVPDWVILAIACVAQFMVVLDVSIVNVALPSIGRDLHYSPTGLQWVVNAYVLTFAGFLLLGGRAADLFGRRRVYMFGLGLFTLASLVGGFAQTTAWLTAARAAQGVGGAFLSPATLTIIVTTFSGARMAKALGIWSAVAGAGGAAGAILGGVLTAGISWRWVLFVNIPIGAAAMFAALTYLTEARRPAGATAAVGQSGRKPRLDIAGAVTVTAGLGALIYAIVGTDTHPWGSTRTLAILAVAAVLLAVFAVIQLRVAATPLVPFRLFRSRAVSGANLVMFLVGAAFFAFWYFMSLYLQNVLGYGALKAGMAFVPMAVAIIVGAQVSARMLSRVGVRPGLVAGTLLAAGGFLWLSAIDAHSGYWSHIFGPGCLISLALGLLFTPLASAATSGVHYSEAGLASGVLNTSRQVGGSLGLAVLATVAIDRTSSLLRHGDANHAALTSGYSIAFVVAAGLCVVAFLSSLIVPALGSAPRGTTAPERSAADQVDTPPIGAEMA
ncbi:MFS transporter [Acidiferrimicrobium sp. IK]|uniref:MFS transporter n=1 Tax=Acidiferrimicrobium sp. IK TaxID=2871700 RepID=UPI0021CB545C|nr:MFS transporter [Acidiferrimicrobium sp. IK]MCU4182802.1 MFS transporter [Acidiferrimicrobium sp. IK]